MSFKRRRYICHFAGGSVTVPMPFFAALQLRRRNSHFTEPTYRVIKIERVK